ENLASSLVPTIGPEWVGRAAVVGAWAWLSAGVLRDLLAAREEGGPVGGRPGFVELVVVVGLTLPMLLLGDWLLRASECGRRVFRSLAVVLLALLFVVMGSALQGLRLYVNEY